MVQNEAHHNEIKFLETTIRFNAIAFEIQVLRTSIISLHSLLSCRSVAGDGNIQIHKKESLNETIQVHLCIHPSESYNGK